MKTALSLGVALLFILATGAEAQPTYGGGTAGNVPASGNDLGQRSGVGGGPAYNRGREPNGAYVYPNQNPSANGSSGVPTGTNNAAPIGSTDSGH